MNVNRESAGDSRRIKMFSSWALFKTVRKRLLEDNTFLIASYTSAVSPCPFFMITSGTSTNWGTAQYLLSKLHNRIRIEPFCNRGSSNIILAIMKFVSFLTADAQATIPIDVQFIPGGVAEYACVRHVYQVFDLPSHSPLLLAHS